MAKKMELWAHTKRFGKPWNETLVTLFAEKPRKTKRVPWYHTVTGSIGWLSPDQYTALTGKKPPRKLTRLRLAVLK